MLGWLPPFLRVVWHPSLFCVPVCLGLLYAGDKLVEVNGVSVEGLDPEQVIHILVTVSSSPYPWLTVMLHPAPGVCTVTGGGFESLLAAYSLQALELVCFYASCPPHLLPFPS